MCTLQRLNSTYASDQSPRWPHKETLHHYRSLQNALSEDSDQTERMYALAALNLDASQQAHNAETTSSQRQYVEST